MATPPELPGLIGVSVLTHPRRTSSFASGRNPATIPLVVDSVSPPTPGNPSTVNTSPPDSEAESPRVIVGRSRPETGFPSRSETICNTARSIQPSTTTGSAMYRGSGGMSSAVRIAITRASGGVDGSAANP